MLNKKILSTCDDRLTLNVANKIAFDKRVKLSQEFDEELKKDVDLMDFAANPEASRNVINEWVENITKDKIKNLIPEGSVTEETVMMLVNAVYFKGNWMHKFSKERTVMDWFNVSSNERVKVQMMFQEKVNLKYCKFADDKSKLDVSVVQLPYCSSSSNHYSMLLLIPNNSEDDVNDVILKLSDENCKEIFDSIIPTDVNLTIPKFKLEYKSMLKRVIVNMGCGSIFGNVDLPKFVDVHSTPPIQVSEIIHQAVIEVDEEGTEAAAATAIMMRFCAVHEPEPEPIIDLKFDRPFIFMLLEDTTQLVLFLGLLRNPSISSA
ncbi:SERPINB3 (predicted) [Pycnogonum litorale]